MKKLKKRFMMTSLLLAALIMAMPSGAFASSSVSETVSGVSIYGSVSIGNGQAFASSSSSAQVYQSVELNYTYGLAGTTLKKTITGFDNGYKTSVSAVATASEFGSVSVSAAGYHTWVIGSNDWKRNTSVTA